ncbi:MAG: bifunctional DNA primase/polymerase [Phycisphaerales bacterium]|nr:bifunctional DNA primase/polymerase [Phycisphaerales bacterium]
MSTFVSTSRSEAAATYMARGYRCIPVPKGEKGPRMKGWQHTRLGPGDLAAFEGEGNLGILTGEPSGWLVDIDLDCDEALRLADECLPPTEAVTGRLSTPRSHRWFIAAGAVSCRIEDPLLDECIVELRAGNLQTLVGPSIHPESGEPYAVLDGEPAVIDAALLEQAVRALGDRVLRDRYPGGVPPSPPRGGDLAARARPAGAGSADPETVARAGAYLDKMPGAVSGQGGHRKAYAAACAICHGFGLDREQALDLLVRRYNPRCHPPWSQAELDHKVNDAITKPHSREFGWLRDAGADLGGVDVSGIMREASEPPPDPRAEPNDEHDLDMGAVRLGTRDPTTGRLVLSPKRTLPTARAYVRQFHDHPHGRTLICYADQLMAWAGNRYAAVEDSWLRHRLQPWLHATLRYQKKGNGPLELVPFESNPTSVKAALESIRALVHLPAEVTPPCWMGAPGPFPAGEVLPCRTGSLHVPTGTLLSATPLLFTVNALDFDYDPQAPAPVEWLKFLGELWGDDHESIQLIQEWFGYSLIADTSQQKMLLLVGPKRSGKGTIGRVLRSVVGEANVVGPTTGSLAGNFGLQPLIGKTLAVVSDARFSGEGAAVVIERLLCVSGEDLLTIDRKFLSPVTMKLPTRFVFLTNELPRLHDSSTALAGRFLMPGRLTRSFYGQEDPTLTDRLLKERAGILNWSLEGWKRLKARGHFVPPASGHVAVEELEELSSPVSAFVRQCCKVGVARRVWLSDLFARWQSWCAGEGRDNVGTKQSLGRELGAAVPGIVRRRGSDGQPFYEGISLAEVLL